MEDRVITVDANNSALHESVQEYALKMRGHVRILVDDEKKGSYVHFDDHNIIVNGAKKVMAVMIAKGDNSYKISGLELGTGHTNSSILDVTAPQANETHLATPMSPRTWIPVGNNYSPDSLNNNGIAKFTFVLAKGAGNGDGVVAYTEAGLWAVGDPDSTGATLFALETFPALIKNNSRQITFEWSIIF